MGGITISLPTIPAPEYPAGGVPMGYEVRYEAGNWRREADTVDKAKAELERDMRDGIEVQAFCRVGTGDESVDMRCMWRNVRNYWTKWISDGD